MEDGERSARDLTGFFFGISSILCWIVAQVPQFITNIKRQRADALSPWFLAEWLMVSESCACPSILCRCHTARLTLQGDTCNLIGCLMTGNQLATVTYTAT